jgi:hypothetical protein
MPHKTHLEAKVAAVNAAHSYALTLYTTLRPVLEPFVGQQIEKADGGLLQKVAKLLPELPYTHNLAVIRNSSTYSLIWSVKACESYPSSSGDTNFAVYHEISVYVGHMEGNKLVSFYDPPDFKTGYTVKEVEALRAAYRKAKNAADAALSAIQHFGEYDR